MSSESRGPVSVPIEIPEDVWKDIEHEATLSRRTPKQVIESWVIWMSEHTALESVRGRDEHPDQLEAFGGEE